MDFFNALFELAELRLQLLEETTPIERGKVMKKEYSLDMKKSRWIVRYHGQDLALRVIHG
jgi:hypothetical protein